MTLSRTEVTVATAKMLFALSGNRCAFADPATGVACENDLARPEWNRVRAQMCHIKGEQPNAARYDSNQTDDERRHFDNLIVMCPNHHYEIDSLRPVDFSVEVLTEMKIKAMEGAEPLPPEYSESRINSIAKILSDDYDRTYGLQSAQQVSADQDLPESGAQASPRLIDHPVVTLAGEITPTPTYTTSEMNRQGGNGRTSFFHSVDTPAEAVAFIHDVVRIASTPLTAPLRDSPTSLEPLIPDIRLTLVRFPDLVGELAKTSPRQWLEVTENWATRRQQNPSP
jgi:hypothetical protein